MDGTEDDLTYIDSDSEDSSDAKEVEGILSGTRDKEENIDATEAE